MDICYLEFRLKSLNFIDHWFCHALAHFIMDRPNIFQCYRKLASNLILTGNQSLIRLNLFR